jgi:hypothetical protein
MPRSTAGRALLLLLSALASLPATAGAQACLGFPSFAANHLQVSADLAFSNDVNTFGVAVSGGSSTAFGGVGVGGADFDGRSATTVSGSVGYQVRATSAGRAQVCPILAIGLGFGPKDLTGPGSEQTTRSAQLGLAFGGELMRGGELRLVPSFVVAFNHVQTDIDGPGTSLSDSFGSIGFGLGFVLNNRLSIRPSVTQRVSAADEEPVVGLGIALNFGGRR